MIQCERLLDEITCTRERDDRSLAFRRNGLESYRGLLERYPNDQRLQGSIAATAIDLAAALRKQYRQASPELIAIADEAISNLLDLNDYIRRADSLEKLVDEEVELARQQCTSVSELASIFDLTASAQRTD